MRQSIFKFDEKANVYTVEIAMPAIDKKDVTIETGYDNRIVIKAGGENPFMVQPVYITLNERVDAERADAKLKDGVFTLVIPLEKRKMIKIS